MCPDIQELYVLTRRGSYTREQGDGKEQRARIQNTSQSGTGAQGWSANLACTRPVSIPPAHVLGLPGRRASSDGNMSLKQQLVHSAAPHQVSLLSAFFLFQRLNSRCAELITWKHHVMATIVGFLWLPGQLRLAKRTVTTENSGRTLIYPQPSCPLITSEC